MLKQRLNEMKQHAGNLPELEKLYFNIAADLGLFNSSLADYLKETQRIKIDIKKKCKSIAEYNREFELTEVYIILKDFKYQIKGLEKISAGIRIMIDGLRAESRGQY